MSDNKSTKAKEDAVRADIKYHFKTQQEIKDALRTVRFVQTFSSSFRNNFRLFFPSAPREMENQAAGFNLAVFGIRLEIL